MSDPFDTMGVEARFDLDDKLLGDRHRALSKALHPDRYVGRPAAERRMALDRAINVNAAWRTLKDPVKRAETLLARLGVASGELKEPKANPALLMEMMEVREELAEAHQAKDLTRIESVGVRMREKEALVLSQLSAGFSSAFAEGDASTVEEQGGSLVAGLLPVVGELRYVKRFFEELDAIEEQLMD